jgi:hypothetical protein
MSICKKSLKLVFIFRGLPSVSSCIRLSCTGSVSWRWKGFLKRVIISITPCSLCPSMLFYVSSISSGRTIYSYPFLSNIRRHPNQRADYEIARRKAVGDTMMMKMMATTPIVGESPGFSNVLYGASLMMRWMGGRIKLPDVFVSSRLTLPRLFLKTNCLWKAARSRPNNKRPKRHPLMPECGPHKEDERPRN